MSLFDTKEFFNKIGIKPKPIEYTSPITGQTIKRSAPTRLKDSIKIVQNNLKQYRETHISLTNTYDDYEYDDNEITTIKDQELVYTTTENECKNEINTLLQFIEEMANEYTPKTLYIERQNTTISYGELSAKGTKIQHGIFEISNDKVLKAIYELIRIRYTATFDEHFTINPNGISLCPFISEETDILFTSNRKSDLEWILNEKEIIQERNIQKKGYTY